ncbi:hypothetical protein [Lutibacter sp.]|uniref:hypothetical protein n=1 Tax=Lutibacter sp. TaxID=1925666 RepID=UPI003568BB70
MTRFIQKPDGKGSLKDIQILINKNQEYLNSLIKSKLSDLKNDEIIWPSPLENDDFAEYRDDDFLIKLGLDPAEIQLDKFWPKKGPQWDALGKTESGKVILVEAKANIPEIVSPKTCAKKKSKCLIDFSLNETKQFLNINNETDWSGKFYQYTNRIAHLYFLREKCKKPTYLINIYFIGDKTVSGPKTKQEWDGALKVLYMYFGIKRHKLSKYMLDLFIDVNDLK